MTDAEEMALLLRSAIPIDDVDQMLAPGLNSAVVWIDISGWSSRSMQSSAPSGSIQHDLPFIT